MSNNNPQNQPALAPFKTRLRAVGSLYFTNKNSLFWMIWLIWAVLNFSILGSRGQNSQSQQEQAAIQNAEMGLESIKKAKVHFASRGFETEKDKSHRVSNAEQRLIQAKRAYREAKERNRKKLLNESLLLILMMVMGALTTLVGVQLRTQVFNSRLTMIPGFLLPHLIVAFGIIAISLAFVSGFMQYWYGASFWACFSLVFFLVGIFIYGINFSTRLLGLLIYPIIPTVYLHYYIQAEFFGYYVDGQYPWLTVGLLLFALLILVLNIRSLICLSEEDIDYTISASWDEYFERIKSRFRSLSQKCSWGFTTSNKNTQNQPAIAPFKTRLWATCRIYLTNKSFLCFLIFLALMFVSLSTSYWPSGANLRILIQENKQRIANLDGTIGPEERTFFYNSEKDRIESLEMYENYLQHLEVARHTLFTHQLPFVIYLLASGVGYIFGIQLKAQIINPRSVLFPGFFLPHLIAGIGGVLLTCAIASSFAWYRVGASFPACFSLAVLYAGGVLYVINFSRLRLLNCLSLLVIIIGYILYFTSKDFVAGYIGGQYLGLSTVLFSFGLLMLAAYAWSIQHIDEEDPDYVVPLTLREALSRRDSKSRDEMQKISLRKPSWYRNANDWLFQFFQDRVAAGTQWDRVWHWQTSRGGQAVVLLGVSSCVAIVAAIVILFDLHILNTGQLGEICTGLLFFGLIGFSMVMLFSWVRHSSKLDSEMIRPMARLQFVKSLILTHLLEVSLLAVPVWLGSLLYFWIYHPDQGIVVSIISICCAVIYVCLFPWIISFRSMFAVCGFYGIIFSVVLPTNMFLRRSGISEIQFSIWQQSLLLVCSLCVGLLLLADTKRRWMNTEFGR